MAAHDLWHAVVLGSVLVGAAGVAISAVAAVAFEALPPVVARARPVLVTLGVVGGILVVGEWLLVH